MTDWLNGLDMRDGEFACQQVHVCSCQDCPNAIHDASAQLVADLPTSFRAAVLADAEAMAGACVRLCPDVPWLTRGRPVQRLLALAPGLLHEPCDSHLRRTGHVRG